MKFHVPRLALLLPLCLCMLGWSTQASPAQNPLKSFGTGLKKVGRVLTPWKKPPPPPAEKRAQVTAQPAKSAKTAKAEKPAPRPVAKSVKTTAPKPSKKPNPSPAGTKPKASTAPAGTSATAKTSKTAKKATGAEKSNSPSPAELAADHASPPVSDPPGPAQDTPPPPAPTPEAGPPPAPVVIPFATPVMGRKGYVHSPFAEAEGMVDVTDIPAGTKVKCPFTGGIFRVP